MVATEELIRVDEGAAGTQSNDLQGPLASRTLVAPSTFPVVTVSSEDIQLGEPGNYRSCPIARALWRVFPEAKSITVAEDETTEVVIDGFFYRLPEEAARFIEDFDVFGYNDKDYVDSMRPFQFELEPD